MSGTEKPSLNASTEAKYSFGQFELDLRTVVPSSLFTKNTPALPDSDRLTALMLCHTSLLKFPFSEDSGR
jgi:hypothetical protein